MTFKEAFEAMKHGAKVRLPGWLSYYWYWDEGKETVMTHSKPLLIGGEENETDIKDERWKNEENTMKICDVVRLCKTYGENTTLAELQKEIQGNKIHKCPKCSGTGKITKKRNKAQYWECCDDYEYYDVECDLCNGQGYTEHMYKPKMIQDGWEQEN